MNEVTGRMIEAAQRKKLHALLNALALMPQKAELVSAWTNRRTASSAEMLYHEAYMLITELEKQQDDATKAMRGKCIVMLKKLGYVDALGNPDWLRINAYIKKIGTNNPRKVQLSYLYRSELTKVLTQLTIRVKKQEQAAS